MNELFKEQTAKLALLTSQYDEISSEFKLTNSKLDSISEEKIQLEKGKK